MVFHSSHPAPRGPRTRTSWVSATGRGMGAGWHGSGAAPLPAGPFPGRDSPEDRGLPRPNFDAYASKFRRGILRGSLVGLGDLLRLQGNCARRDTDDCGALAAGPVGGALSRALVSIGLGVLLAGSAQAGDPLASTVSTAQAPALTPTNATATTVIIVVGAAGEAEFGTNFLRQTDLWREACARAGAQCLTIGTDAARAPEDGETLRQTLEAERKDGSEPLWLVLLGHGTFDGRTARFNLRGPDLAATNLAMWLGPFRRPLAVIDTTSASAPFLDALSASNRVLVTATRSGSELNFARFGQFLAEAIASPGADLDQDGQTSLLEAFLSASARVAEFYRTEGRLLTEHALLDDNGDGLGTPADWFRGIRAVKRARDNASLDSVLAHQFVLVPSAEERQLPAATRVRRDALERAVFEWRDRKSSLGEDEYYRRLEALLLELAELEFK